MTGAPSPEDGSSVASLESFPDGSLSRAQYRSLEESDAIDIAAPVVLRRGSGRATHLDLVIGDTHYYVGWNPGEGQWERILVVTEEEDTAVVEQVSGYFDDETGDPEFWFDVESDPGVEDIVEFIWRYVEYTYPDTSGLRSIIGEAVEGFDEE